MTLCDRTAGTSRRILDRLSFTWIVCAPLLVLAAAWLGFLEIDGPAALAAPPAAAAEPSGSRDEVGIGMDEVGSGELLRKGPGGLTPLPMLDLRVHLDVTGIMVHGEVVQTFVNPTQEVIETVYVFPLPENAAVHAMEMRIGARRIVSVIQEKRKARKTYEKARKEGRKAALVEQDRPNLFTTSAANINPGEEIRVVLEYIQELRFTDGEFRLHFPLTYTPRFFPPHISGEGLAEARKMSPAAFADHGSPQVPRAAIRATIRPGVPIGEVHCPSHAVRTRWEGDAMVLSPLEETVVADRDFRLRWSPLSERDPVAAVMVEDRGEDRYALLMLIPPEERFGPGSGLPTETVFVVDVSGSMDGPSIVHARDALLEALDRLRPGDTFGILAFNDRLHRFRDRFVPAHGEELESARRWVEGLQARGGTMILPALRGALRMFAEPEDDRVRRIIFLTDGAVGNEAEMLQVIHGSQGKVRLHTLGIGHAPNRYLMRKMAARGGGLCEFIASSSDAVNRVDAFFRTIDRPVATDLALEWEGVEPWEVYPAGIGDLHAGQPLYVSARFAPGDSDGRVILKGRVAGGEFRSSMDLRSGAPRDSGVATRWARAKIGERIDSLHQGSDEADVRAAVIRLSKAYRIVTRYTSLVAVEEFPSAWADAKTRSIPNGLPAGSTLRGCLPSGGTLEPLLTMVALALLLCGGILLALRTVVWR